VRIAHSWLVNKIITLSVSLHLPYMVKHKVLLDNWRSHSWTLLLVMGPCIYLCVRTYHVRNNYVTYMLCVTTVSSLAQLRV